MLVRSSIVVDCSPRGPRGEGLAHGVDCSRCCQQNASGLKALRGLGLGDGCGDFNIDLRHGLPVEVIPLHVAAGFLLSDLGSRDSGVCGICILVVNHSNKPDVFERIEISIETLGYGPDIVNPSLPVNH